MKKTISLLLAICLIFAAVPMGAAAANVMLSPQKLSVNGIQIECEKYNIDGSNYFKLRDIAYLLNGTENQFGVGYDNLTHTVTVTSGTAYVPNGSELVIGEDKSATAVPSAQTILINGAENAGLSVYNLGGNNYFKLRDLGAVLGFLVDYDKESNTAIIESRDYSEGKVPSESAGSRVLSASEIYRICSPAVFFIMTFDAEGEPYATGSGFFVHESGIAVTNCHVLEGAFSAAAVLSDGKEYAVSGVLHYDSEMDYAVIRVEGSGFSVLEIGDSSGISGGDTVYAIGSPRGLQNTISDGIISNPSRDDFGGMIQITTPISSGSSGGALIDAGGRVIGITTASLATGQNLNFAVPINPVLAGQDLPSYINNGTIMTLAEFAGLSGHGEASASGRLEAYHALKRWVMDNYNDTAGSEESIGYFSETSFSDGARGSLGVVYSTEDDYLVLCSIYEYSMGDYDYSYLFLNPYDDRSYVSYLYYDASDELLFQGSAVLDPLTFSGRRDVVFDSAGGIDADAEDISDYIYYAMLSFCESLGFAEYLFQQEVQPLGTYSIAAFGFDPYDLTVPD